MPYLFWMGAAIVASVTAPLDGTIVTVPVVNLPAPPVPNAMPAPPAKGQKSVAIPKSNPGTWATTNDYPTKALSERREGTTGFKLSIDASGNPTACSVTQASGHADLDEATCSNIMRRGTFYPAQDEKGAAVAGEWSSRVRWQIPTIFSTASQTIADRSFPRPPKIADFKQLQIKESDYPADALAEGFQGRTEVALGVSPTGSVVLCTIAKTSGHTSLDQKSCDLARKWKFNPAASRDGYAIEGVSAHSFDWRLPKGSFGLPPRPTTERNPFEKPGMMTLTLDFDSDGKLANCQSEFKGEFGFLPKSLFSPDQLCKNPPTSRIKPFANEKGENEPRRVVLKFEIAHEAWSGVTETSEAD